MWIWLDADVVGSALITPMMANFQNMAVAERREAEQTTKHRKEVGLAGISA